MPRFIGPPVLDFVAHNGRLMEVLIVAGVAFFTAKEGQVPAIVYECLFGRKGTSDGKGDIPGGNDPPSAQR